MTIQLSHERARELSSASFDGEIAAAERADLSDHLDACAACTAYSQRIRDVSMLTAAMPRLGPAATLAPATVELLNVRPLTHVRFASPRSMRWRVAPLAVAATVLAVVIGIAARPGVVFAPLPASAEVASMQRITSVYLERDIVETPGGDLAERRRIAEKLWWQAPDLLRVERTVVDANGRRTDELVVRRGVERFDSAAGGGVITRRGAPDLDVVPEPLSATLSLLGRATGPGPVVAGRPTTTYELEIEGARRIAHVDNTRFIALGGEDRFVLSKEQLINGVPVATRTVRRLDLNVPIDSQRFVLPGSGEVRDLGFVERSPAQLAINPPARPRGLRVVRAVANGSTEALLFQRGAFPVFVTTGTPTTLSGPVEVQTTTVRDRVAVVRIPLYGVPSVTLTVDQRPITVTAPLRPADLVELVAQMYFGPE